MNHEYFIDGQSLKAVGKVRDLDVITTPDFSHSEQTREVAARTARQTKFILRCFVVTGIVEYLIPMFQTYVLPILTYCSPVWSPRYKKDKKLIQSVYDRFRKGVAHPCVMTTVRTDQA